VFERLVPRSPTWPDPRSRRQVLIATVISRMRPLATIMGSDNANASSAVSNTR
jgi:hypothetical protein